MRCYSQFLEKIKKNTSPFVPEDDINMFPPFEKASKWLS